MPRATLAAVAALASLVPSGVGCAVGGALPPSRTDVGSTLISSGGQMVGGLRVTTGAHWASGTTRRDIDLDVGAGYVYERVGRVAVEAESLALGGSEGGGGARPDDVAEAHGGYVEVARAIDLGTGHRSWLGARGELLSRETPDGRRAAGGAYARAAWELFATGEGATTWSSACSGGAGFAHGTTAVGLFVESGAQWSREQRGAFVVTAGLSVRLPTVFGGVIDLCPSF